MFLSLDAIFLGAQMFLLQPGEIEGMGRGVVMCADTLHHIANSVIRGDICLSSAIAESNRTKNATEATQDDTTLEFPSLHHFFFL